MRKSFLRAQERVTAETVFFHQNTHQRNQTATEISFLEFVQAVNMAEPGLDEEAASEAASEALAESRELFDLLDGDSSGSLSREEIAASPELVALIMRSSGDEGNGGDAVRGGEAEAVDRFLAAADLDGDSEISFTEFAAAVSSEQFLSLAVANDALTAAAQNRQAAAASDANAAFSTGPSGAFLANRKLRKGRGGGGLLGKRKSPEDRFDAMLDAVLEWEQDLGEGPVATTNDANNDNDDDDDDDDDVDDDDRLLVVLRGAFAGVHCAPVKEALRVCYLEYSALRLGGDLIFKLLKRIVAAEVISS